jgi:RNA 3'-terminal phosphate cyclase (ATP)
LVHYKGSWIGAHLRSGGGVFRTLGLSLLCSSLALSLVTGRPFVIEKIRAGRKKPGLMRQHLTAVLAAAEVGNAEVEGAALGRVVAGNAPHMIGL